MAKKAKSTPLSPVDITLSNLKSDIAKDIVSIVLDKYPEAAEGMRWISTDSEIRILVENYRICVYEWDAFEESDVISDAKKGKKVGKDTGSDVLTNIIKHITLEYPKLIPMWNKTEEILYIDGLGVTLYAYKNGEAA